MKSSSGKSGFTIVELIVTIVVAGIFITIISNMSGYVVNTATSAHRTEAASNLAYNNLRIYANGGSPIEWFTCNGDDTSDSNASFPFTDGKRYPTTAGQVLINTTSTTSVNKLPPPVIQKVTAVAPYGCGNNVVSGATAPSTMPVRVVSTVTYGSPARSIVHATYVGY